MSFTGFWCCAYCCCDISSLDMPNVDDDDAWESLAREHEAHCEWVLTRAHRIDPPAQQEAKPYSPEGTDAHLPERNER